MSRNPKFSLANRKALPSTAALMTPGPAPASLPTGADPIAMVMDQAAADMPRLLTPQEVAEMLGLTERTLERWRITGEGPRYSKLSRSTVRYTLSDVAAFVADRMRANTSQ